MSFLIISIFILYFTKIYQVFAIGTYGFTFIDLFLFIFYIVFLKNVFYHAVKLRFSFNYTFVLLLLFLCLGLISGLSPLFSMDKVYIVQFLKTFAHLIFIALFTVICYIYEIKPQVWEKIIKIWIVLSIFINLFAIYQLFARIFDLPLAWIEMTNQALTMRGTIDENVASMQLSLRFQDFYRATSIFSEPATLAVTNLIMLSFMITPYFHGKPPYIKSNLLNAFAVILCIVTMFLTFSLTAVVGLFLILLIIFIFFRNKRIKTLVLYFILGIFLVTVSDSIIEKYTKISIFGLFEKKISSVLQSDKKKKDRMVGDSFDQRLETAKIAINIMERNPIIGVGLGQTQYDTRFNIIFIDFSSFAVLAEMGILGLVVFAGIFIGVFYHLIRLLKDRKLSSGLPDDLSRLIGTMLVTFAIIFQTNFISANNLVTHNLWFFLAMALSLINSSYIKNNINVYEFSLVKRPLKELLNEKLVSYQQRNSNKDK